jgi:rhodanese-related sulfurtransferase
MLPTIVTLAVLTFVAVTLYYAAALATVSRVRRSLRTGNSFLVDIDSVADFAVGHRDGAINIPYDDLARRAHELDPRSSVVICGRGWLRTIRGASMLRSLGFHDVRSIGRSSF